MLNKRIRIKNKYIDIPLIQGGMGIGISRCRLAGAVAKEGGMGVLSTAQIGYDDPEFRKNPEAVNLKVLPEQIRKAKELSGGNGMIGVNIMAVTRLYEDYVRTACEAGVDAIITGAGLPTDLPGYAREYDVAIAPIVSTEKSAKVILKFWDKRYNRTADFLVIEGPRAGGHLGFSPEELEHMDQIDYDGEITKILKVKEQYEEKYRKEIPVFIAGGIFSKEDVAHALDLGADGVQVASRFVATEECDASEAFKYAYVSADESDIVIIRSPVGMPGRAVRNKFIEKVQRAPGGVQGCYNCLKACSPATAEYCISQALINAAEGNLEEGLIFCGSRTGEIQEITTVHQVLEDLLGN